MGDGVEYNRDFLSELRYSKFSTLHLASVAPSRLSVPVRANKLTTLLAFHNFVIGICTSIYAVYRIRRVSDSRIAITSTSRPPQSHHD